MIPILSLNHRDARPLHQQVSQGLRQLIVKSALKPDDKLPGVRELASTLAINPNTIARAYRDLEAEGYVHSIAGKGTFVSPREDIGQQRREGLLSQWERVTAELLYLGAGVEELCEKVRAMPAAAQEGGVV